ncbi:MAG: phosphoadenylyl-sulfate reductase [Chloroflexi bacterium]|nr:MAG: phosphoadenylyl-sulfate reductase [Phototrophicales bacterium]RMF81920.1 MAG: phosphoadenylyl-sulfate reductase [Chloroflexota bacterium]
MNIDITASETLRDELDELNNQFETGYAQDVLHWASETFGKRLAIVTSFQPTGIVTLHQMSEIAPDTTVLTLDTGLLFPETYALIDELEARLNLNLVRVKPRLTVDEQAARHGDALWETSPDHCCHLRKVVPLGDALVGYHAWISGLRRDQSPQRANTPIVSWDSRYHRVKLAPFATWTEDMIWAYIHVHNLPYNELHDRGYPSIGCFPCTSAVAQASYSRDGRWNGHNKIECGIHLAS